MTKILLVEDDKTIVANLTEFLNNEGYIVKSVTGQTAALDLLSEEKADLVLLDVSLAEGMVLLLARPLKLNMISPSFSLQHPAMSLARLLDLNLARMIIFQSLSVRESWFHV